MNEAASAAERSSLFSRLHAAYLTDEADCVGRLATEAALSAPASARVASTARGLVGAVRAGRPRAGLDTFLQEYDLSSDEGVLLMCLAEALLRIPDAATADKLIHDKLTQGDWDAHLGQDWMVNAATWGLMLTGRLAKLKVGWRSGLQARLKRLVVRSGEPVVRSAIKTAMEVLASQFVFGRTIEEALERARKAPSTGTLSICSAKLRSRARMPTNTLPLIRTPSQYSALASKVQATSQPHPAYRSSCPHFIRVTNIASGRARSMSSLRA